MSHFGRALIRKSTGKLIEFQSGDRPLGTLTKNAVNAGIPENDIEEKYITVTEFQALMATSSPKPEPEIDFKSLYAKAVSVNEKLDVLAQKLKLV